MRRTLRALGTVIGTAFGAAPLRATAVLALAIGTALSTTLLSLWMKLITNGLVNHDMGQAMTGAIMIAVSLTTFLLIAWTGFTARIGLEERASLRIDTRIIELTAGIAGMEHHERPDYLDELALLHEQRRNLSSAVGALVESLSAFARIAATASLLATIHPALLALPLFGLPSLILTGRAEKIVETTQEAYAENGRALRHLFSLGMAAESGKEVRIFGVGPELVRRQTEGMAEVADAVVGARVRAALLTTAGWAIFSCGFIAAIAFVLNLAAHHRASVGDVVLAISLGADVNGDVRGIAQMVGWLFHSLKTVNRYLWLVDYAKTSRIADENPSPAPTRIDQGIDLRDVTFRYPGTDRDILTNVSLHIPAGSTLAIVGDNGAGKTTLVKLLCRFYEPTSGAIAIDGVELSRIDIAAWRERISAGFQDFARFEFPALEVVGAGDLPHMQNTAVVTGALERASAVDVIDGLTSGLDTQLGKSFAGGVELSGGQWQKLALGRAMMRDAPLLLVLDEPTSALDAQTEHALFERYAGAARSLAERAGTITVFVSHRFSTVRMADWIVVVDGGRVVEFGSHTDLMARGGLYAELYELQARAYR